MYTFSSRIRYSETDPQGTLKMESLIDYFQDCSTFQSEDLGIGISYMKERGAAWVINYWQLDIHRLPKLGESVMIGTSPYEIKGFIGLRNFMMETPEGERLVNANSVWSLMNLEKLKPERVPQEVLDLYGVNPPFEMEYLPRKVKVPEEGGQPQDPIRVTEAFLDSNMHVNNGQYVRIGMAALPQSGDVKRLRVEYRRQALLGDTIHPVIYTGNTTCISLNAEDGAPYAVLELS